MITSEMREQAAELGVEWASREAEAMGAAAMIEQPGWRWTAFDAKARVETIGEEIVDGPTSDERRELAKVCNDAAKAQWEGTVKIVLATWESDREVRRAPEIDLWESNGGTLMLVDRAAGVGFTGFERGENEARLRAPGRAEFTFESDSLPEHFPDLDEGSAYVRIDADAIEALYEHEGETNQAVRIASRYSTGCTIHTTNPGGSARWYLDNLWIVDADVPAPWEELPEASAQKFVDVLMRQSPMMDHVTVTPMLAVKRVAPRHSTKPETDYHHVCASKPLCRCAGVDDECACMPKRMHRRVTRCIGCGAELRAIHVDTGVELKRGERNSYASEVKAP